MSDKVPAAGEFPAAGWGCPHLARKCHYFDADQSISLCRKWMFTGRRYIIPEQSPEDCATCRRQLDR